ncbi:MAG: hypothetical protein GAK28_00125 [Luteibacter sp.]|uniref:hypothetical protein n=1 Tax=Luteibacter sp. TaxID=1886636 RepID=UPI001384334A|nr:hypothetical protein [Luteibacter sp.]KAF1009487.1 MAG: hypothetical protein GAK28_00125 [Luteibacter sp.]
MDGVKLQGKVYAGYAQAAKRIGLPFQQYRTTSTSGAIVPAALIGTVVASFNAQDMKYGKPNAYGKPLWYCLADGRVLSPGDYLVNAASTYFIAGMQPLLPILAVDCNRMLSFYRPQQQPTVGIGAYGGNTAENQQLIATGFPASVLQGTKGERNEVGLPGDVKTPWWAILLPALPGNAQLRADDVAIDENGRRYVLASAEQTDLGWRLTAAEAGT